jgi:hypothetical protein
MAAWDDIVGTLHGPVVHALRVIASTDDRVKSPGRLLVATPSRASLNLSLDVALIDGQMSEASSHIGSHSLWWLVGLSATGNGKGSGKWTRDRIDVLGSVQLGDVSNDSWCCWKRLPVIGSSCCTSRGTWLLGRRPLCTPRAPPLGAAVAALATTEKAMGRGNIGCRAFAGLLPCGLAWDTTMEPTRPF